MKRFLKIVGLLTLSLLLAWFSFLNSSQANQEARIDDEFKEFGVETTADLVNYEYVVVGGKNGPSRSGDRPVLAYKTKDSNVRYRYVAYEYGLVTSYGKKNLPNQKIVITYLPDKPWVARVEAWHSSQVKIKKFFSAMSGWLCFVSLVLAARSFKTSRSRADEDS
jgi:hypothetical protein